MAFERVRPGDLITANFMNRMLTSIEDLQTRVDQLAQGVATTNAAPVIEDVQPSGTLQPGQEIQVTGRNFAVPADFNDVMVNGSPVVLFKEGTSTRLVFNLPSTIPGTPGAATLVIRVGEASASRVLQIGELHVTPHGKTIIPDPVPPAGQIHIGDVLTFNFSVDAQTNIAESYTLSASYSSAVGATVNDWLTRTTILVAGNAVNAPASITPGTPLAVQIRVTVPPGAISVNVALRAQSMNNDAELSKTSSPIILTIGAVVVVSDPRATVTFTPFGQAVTNARAAQIDGLAGIELAFGQSRICRFRLTAVGAAGTYTYTTALEPDAGSWTLSAISPLSSIETIGSSEDLGLTLTLNATAVPGSHPEKRMLKISAHNAENNFDSFLRMPIQGFTP